MNKLRKYTVRSSLAHIYCNDLSDLHKGLITVAENISSSKNETFSCYHSSKQIFSHLNARKVHMIYFMFGNTYCSLVSRTLLAPRYFCTHYMAHFVLKFLLLHQNIIYVICYLSNTLLINEFLFSIHITVFNCQ